MPLRNGDFTREYFPTADLFVVGVDDLFKLFSYFHVTLFNILLKMIVGIKLLTKGKKIVFPAITLQCFGNFSFAFAAVSMTQCCKFLRICFPSHIDLMISKPYNPLMCFTTTSRRRLSNRRFFCIFLEVDAA